MKRTRTVVWTATAAGVLAIATSAMGGPMEDRQATMKAVGQSMKEGAGLNSATGFDAAKAKTTMDSVAAAAKKLKGLYPPGSGDDPKSAADPKIWTNKADFEKKLADMGAAATAAGKATTADAFKPAYATLGATCKSCHDTYRKKKTT